MGVFLEMSGVAQIGTAQVEAALREFATEWSGDMRPLEAGESLEGDTVVSIVGSQHGNVTVIYPNHFVRENEASAFLSTALKRPVFSLAIYDSDCWYYTLYVEGQDVDRFMTSLVCLGELSEQEMATWAGNADVVCSHWPGVTPDRIRNYLVLWDETRGKAYPGDHGEADNDWQILDFMEKLGLHYPGDDTDPGVSRFFFRIKDPDDELFEASLREHTAREPAPASIWDRLAEGLRKALRP